MVIARFLSVFLQLPTPFAVYFSMRLSHRHHKLVVSKMGITVSQLGEYLPFSGASPEPEFLVCLLPSPHPSLAASVPLSPVSLCHLSSSTAKA